jgi:hypothetical protein
MNPVLAPVLAVGDELEVLAFFMMGAAAAGDKADSPTSPLWNLRFGLPREDIVLARTGANLAALFGHLLRSQAQPILALDFFTADLLYGAKVHVMERWIGSCRRELLDRTLVRNQRARLRRPG